VTDAPRASLWLETTPQTEFPQLRERVSVDVAVVGGGIAGISAAVLLKRAGKTVAVIDSKRILQGATGYTTAKVTAGHGVIYRKLQRRFGRDGARLYAEANQHAIAQVARFVEDEGISCEFERKPNYVYGESDEERSTLEEEAEAARAAGLPASFTTDLPLPYPVVGAVRLDDQAQFHPRKYLLTLAATIPGDGSHVLELTRVTDVRGDRPIRLRADTGELEATDVILATHLPILDRGFFFAKAHPHRSYAVAARIPEERDPRGMYINMGIPTRSLRTARDERGLLLLVGGEGHKPGTEPDTERRYRTLEEFAHNHFDVTEFPYRWSTQDYMPVDDVPYVGRLTRRSDHVYVATGFKKWGMSNGTAAAIVLTDLILGRPNRWAELYDAKRLKPVASAPKFVKENAAVGKRWLLDRIGRTEEAALDELGPGEGRIATLDGKKRAVYRAESGALHVLSPVCTHLACHVSWNPAEQSWDCPCHGSRFAGDGTVIQGPAARDLKRFDLNRNA
jgi:glycine/D-amino acid oxidase-like deaminating enzyme